MNATRRFLPSASSPLSVGGTVGDDAQRLHPLALGDAHPLVVGVALVRAGELHDRVVRGGAVVVHDGHQVRGHLGHDAALGGRHGVARVHGHVLLHAGAHVGGLGAEQRHGLTLHVRAHERAVGVVVLEERDQGGGRRHHLARGHVHVVDLVHGREHGLAVAAALAAEHELLLEPAVLIHRGVRLGDLEGQLVVGGQVVHGVRDPAVDHAAVRGLDEAEGVDPAEGRQRPDEADVRAFRGLDGAHAAVVRRVDVTDLHAGTVAGQAARAERGQATLVRQAGQRVVLVHELGQLRGAEELLDRRHHGADVDQGLRGDRLDVLGGHALAHDALHAGQAGADLVLDQLAHRTDATVAEVVDVVDLHAHIHRLAVARALDDGLAGVQRGDEVHHLDDVVLGEHRRVGVAEVHVHAELAVELVAAHLGEVVALRGEVQVVQQRLRGVDGGRLARAQLAVDVEQGLVLVRGAVLLEGGADGVVVAELLQDAGLGPAHGLEQHRHGLLALAVEADADLVTLVHLELEPGAARGDDLRGEDLLVRGLVRGALEVGARGADQLGDDDALGAVDDERAVAGHQREVAHEDGLLLDLAGRVVHELGLDVQRGGEGRVAILALLLRHLRVGELGLGEGQGHGALEVLDRGDLLEDVRQSRGDGHGVVVGGQGGVHARGPPLIADQAVERLGLQRQQVRHVQRLGDLGEGDASGGGAGSRGDGSGFVGGARGDHVGSFHRPSGFRSLPCRETAAPAHRYMKAVRNRAGHGGTRGPAGGTEQGRCKDPSYPRPSPLSSRGCVTWDATRPPVRSADPGAS